MFFILENCDQCARKINPIVKQNRLNTATYNSHFFICFVRCVCMLYERCINPRHFYKHCFYCIEYK